MLISRAERTGRHKLSSQVRQGSGRMNDVGAIGGKRKLWRLQARREYVERLTELATTYGMARSQLVDVVLRQFFSDCVAGRAVVLSPVGLPEAELRETGSSITGGSVGSQSFGWVE